MIEAIIALPSKLFYGTGIPAAIVIFNKNKPEDHKNKIIIIDAEQDFEEGKNQNRLRKKDIRKIVSAFEGYRDIEKYARVIDIKELVKMNTTSTFVVMWKIVRMSCYCGCERSLERIKRN